MVVIIQNDPRVPLGNYRESLDAAKVQYRIVRPYAGDVLPTIVNLVAVIVLGGSMGADDEEQYSFLIDVKQFITEVVKEGIPYLGICLGGQLLASVTGGRVVANENGEKGVLSIHLTEAGAVDPLFFGVPAEFVTFQWHNDTFYPPPGALLLATSPACQRQAFRIGAAAYGVQFHPEVTRELIDCWVRWTGKEAAVMKCLLAEFIARENEYMDVSRGILRNFLRIAGLVSGGW